MQSDLTINLKHFIQSLYAQGVRHVVISPGSRTTPVALLWAEFAATVQPDMQLHIAVDERDAGFLGLGLAKTQQMPVALLATSGTATVNYAPAIAEAAVSHVPLIAVTTDRPEELQGIGAPQTLDQQALFGTHVKKALAVTMQSTTPDTTEYIDYAIQDAVHVATQQPAGPIQLNLPLRKPLMPDLNQSWPVVEPIIYADSTTQLELPATLLAQLAEKVMFLAGPAETVDYQQQLQAVAERHAIPVLADVLGQIRPGANDIGGIDALIESDAIATLPKPRAIVRFGGTPVSAKVLQWLKAEQIPVVQVGENFVGRDHSRVTRYQLDVGETPFLNAFDQTIAPQPAAFLQEWQSSQGVIKQAIDNQPLSDIGVVKTMAALPAETQLFIANSMAIRDYDNYWLPERPVTAWANRGANGIDGTIATAVGMAQGHANNWLAIGDLALFHDMNGLMLAKQAQVNLNVLVINNDGGGIFSFLPQAKAEDYFETLFGTPQALSVEKIAALYDAPYTRITDLADLAELVATPADGLRLIEVVTDRAENVAQHQAVLADLVGGSSDADD
ncbi:2-succinyl-5-enolpyruvyl-6-hydroxy-3-cyclohexene-1-carboxylic-acid synthase [Weissella viridescens]|uniref:2-succinyl-5-enolpyruvyl-6-hydroxy-3-cyclohexene-1-carboxylate synthase n=1 Tax=Weissella viridescens TaxID=1629 RepID=A0A3P2RJ97_WEIVI|nr:2-succinyl-5-enolpyruvyl-6-hydroxy-3-cyclohexene-1-carboxylic-acid synthase [Weissella viridescens]RRG18820.1 2-succinyl-5-enolpyruvyl-6-hydroxy-3-cyclohexene-1-carboxylic-acid synthase [Weissella viridescens]